MKEEFLEFLETWGCKEDFLKNAHVEWFDTDRRSFIKGAFVWTDVKQGFTSWSDLHKLWIDYFDYWNEELKAI